MYKKITVLLITLFLLLSFSPLAFANSEATITATNSKPIYRAYNPNSGEHLFATKEEVQSLTYIGWKNEGSAWNSPDTGEAVYRLYNPNHPGGDHHYTPNKAEADILDSIGWNYDNNGAPLFYSGGSVPVYRAYNPNNSRHHYTKEKVEFDSIVRAGWNDEGIGLFALGNEDSETSEDIPVTGISINETSLNLNVGETKNITAQVLPENATNKSVIWSSSNSFVASVDNGTITAKNEGSTTIEVTTEDGNFTATCLVNVAPKEEPISSDFILSSDSTSFSKGSNPKVTFTVISQSPLRNLELYQGDKSVGNFLQSSNDLNGQYVYSCKIPIEEKESQEFYAKTETKRSNNITIYFYDPSNYLNKQISENIIDNTEELGNQVEDENGYVDGESLPSLLDQVEEYARSEKNQNNILDYEKTETSVIFVLKDGSIYAYSPLVPGLAAGGSNGQIEIKTMDPCRDDFVKAPVVGEVFGLTDWIMNVNKVLDSIRNIANTFDNYNYYESSYAGDNQDSRAENWEVTLDAIRTLGPNQLISWTGHGVDCGKFGSALVTGEDYDQVMQNPEYSKNQGLFMRTDDNKAAIFPGFFSKYCTNLNNSFVYIAACYSGKDGLFPLSLLSNGARAVVANNESISIRYMLNIESAVLKNLTEINPDDGNYNTLERALDLAKQEHGEDDHEFLYSWDGTRGVVNIYGSSYSLNLRLKDINNTENNPNAISSVSGKILNMSGQPVEDPLVMFFNNDDPTQGSYGVYNSKTGGFYGHLKPGNYSLIINDIDYQPLEWYITVEPNETLYLEDIKLLDRVIDPNQKMGKVKVYVGDATSSSQVAGANVEIRNKWGAQDKGDVIKTLITNDEGYFEAEMPIGYYTATISKDGFITNSANIHSYPSSSNFEDTATLSPKLEGNDVRIVLTWEKDPRDLDSHMYGSLSNGNKFHVYYSNKEAFDGDLKVCNLDVDDTSGYGKETITLKINNENPYYYYIHHYAGSGGICSTSNAKIELYQGDQAVKVYQVPNDQDDAKYWNVFAIKNGNRLIVENTMTNSPDLEYAN